MTLHDGIIHVACANPILARRLAACGLDRLVLPPGLPALEQLATLAS